MRPLKVYTVSSAQFSPIEGGANEWEYNGFHVIIPFKEKVLIERIYCEMI
jgi:hypothetical protein